MLRSFSEAAVLERCRFECSKYEAGAVDMERCKQGFYFAEPDPGQKRASLEPQGGRSEPRSGFVYSHNTGLLSDCNAALARSSMWNDTAGHARTINIRKENLGSLQRQTNIDLPSSIFQQ